MTRYIVLGNQSLLVNIDKWLQIRDIYFPYVGQENHLIGHAQKIGVYADGRLSWINEQGWERYPAYKNDTLVTESRAINRNMGIDLILEDNVYCEANILLRKITVKNEKDHERKIRVFFYQDFHLYGDGIGDAAIYQMDHNVVVHYKRARYFLMGVLKSNKKDGITTDIEDFAIGQSEGKNYEGTFRDAEDGKLSKNPVAQGSVDSTIGVHLEIPGNSSKAIYYYMTAGRNFQEVYKLNDFVMDNGSESLLVHAEACQRSWVNRTTIDLSGLDSKLVDLFRRSLLIIKTQTDVGGAVLAANDSDNMQFNRDTYSYMWARDGALVSIAMMNAGFPEFAKPFFRFCRDVLWWMGCMLHKYNPDKTLGSSWHPWVEFGMPSVPIQEDETGLVIYALWKYYEATRDLEFVREFYEPLVKKAVFFMNDYRYPNGMPMNSYDLWEERRGIFTFTVSAVYAGLTCAERLGELFGDKETCDACKKGYSGLKELIQSEFFDEERGVFIRGIRYEEGDIDRVIVDRTVDSSVYGVFDFGVLPADDPRVIKTMQTIEEKLWAVGKGGVGRYENDQYRRQVAEGPGNPWSICTLWLAKWYIAKAKTVDDLNKALELINWTANCSLSTGIMPEQVHPYTGESVSVAPLTWSHGEFVDAITRYTRKAASLRKS